MTDSPAGHPPPAFATRIIERAMLDEPDQGLDPSVARLIAATLASKDRPALAAFARTGRLEAAQVSTELTEIGRTFRPTWLEALRRFVAAPPPPTHLPERR